MLRSNIAMTPLACGSVPPPSSTASSALAALCFILPATAALALAAIFMLSTSANEAASASRPGTATRLLSCEPLADVPGKSVTTALVMFPPRAYTPAHRHPGAVTAYVVSGSIRSQMETTPAQTYRPGSTWFEPAGALHLLAENPSASETAELLAVFITDSECGQLVIPEPHGTTQQKG
jgi:quercetin dioxygenase-like cupin family protein